MAVQTNNLVLLDASGVNRTIGTTDSLSIGVPVSFGSNVAIAGNLDVAGDIISRGTTNLVVGDNFIDLNNGNSSTDVAMSGGLTVNVKAAAAADTVVAFALGSVLTPIDAAFSVLGAAKSTIYSIGDIVEITGCTDLVGNNGLFVVSAVNNGKNAAGEVSVLHTQILVAGISTPAATNAPFAQSQFEAGTASASVYRVNLAVMAFSSGALLAAGDVSLAVGNLVSAYAASAWVPVGITTATPGGRTKLYFESAQNVSLQEAYNVGNAIAMTATVGAFDVSPAAGQTVGFSLDGSSASNASVTSGDLTLSTITSGNVILASAGNVDVDGSLITIDATGAISLDAAAASNFSVASANLTLSTTTSGNVIVAAAAVLDADAASMTLDASGAISLDAGGASNFSVASANLTLSTTTSGQVIITSADLMDLNAGASLDIDVTGSFDMLSSTTFSIDGTGASNVSATSGDLTFSTITSGTLILASAGNVDVDGSLITIDATGAISLDAASASNFSVAGASLTLATTGSGNMVLSSAGNASLDGAVISIDGTSASNFSVTSANLTLSTITSGEVAITSAGLLNIDAGAAADIDVTGACDIDATGAISLDAAAASNFSVASANLTLSTTTSGNVIVTAASVLDFNGASIDIDVSGACDIDATAISLDGTSASNFTVTGASLTLATATSGDLNLTSVAVLNADAASMTLDASGAISIDAGGTSNFSVASASLTLATTTSGDLNITSADVLVFTADKAKFSATPVEFGSFAGVMVTLGEDMDAGSIGCWQNDGGTTKFYKSANNDASDDKRVVGGSTQANGVDEDSILVGSVPGTMVPCSFSGAGPGAANVGQPVYLGTGGQVTLVAPSAGGTTVYRVGYLASGSAVNSLYSVMFAPQFIAKRM